MKKHPIVQKSPEILGGTPVFTGTRVPVQTLIDYLEAGETVKDFLDDYPTVKRKQAISLLEFAKKALLEDASTY
jgi:uncharacterized protein (DUF433 family)